jgi:hypothetical protein
MGKQRQAGEEEHKAALELVEQRKKEIQVGKTVLDCRGHLSLQGEEVARNVVTSRFVFDVRSVFVPPWCKQTAVESGEPLDEALRALTGEDGPAAKHGKSSSSGGGGANRVEGHMSGKPRPGSSGYACVLPINTFQGF